MALVFDNLSTGGGGGGTFSAGMSTLGNTAGTTGLVNGQLVLVGGSNILLSQSINGQSATLTINGGAAGSGLTNINLSAGTLSALRSDVTFADSNGISFGLETNGVITGTVKTNYLTTAMASNRGSDFVQATAAFNGTNASGTIASDAISVSVNAQSNQTVGLYASSNTYLTSSGTVDARSLSFRGDKSITVGISAGQVAFSVGAYLTTARASTDAIGLNTAQSNVTWTVNSSGLSLDARGYAGTNAAITGGSITVNSSGVSVNLPAYLSTQSTQYLAMTLGGNTAGTTTFHATNNASLFFNGGNNITLSGNGSTVTISGANQTNQTLGLYMSSNTTSSVSSGTQDARSLTFRGMGIASVGYSGGEVVVSVPVGGGVAGAIGASTDVGGDAPGSHQLGTYWFSNNRTDGPLGISQTTSNNGSYTLLFDIALSNQTWGISNFGNTSGTSGTIDGGQLGMYFAGGNNITLSQSINTLLGVGTITISAPNTVGTATTAYSVASANSVGTVTRWAAEDHRHAGVGGIGISSEGNSSGTSGSQLGTYWLRGGANITISQITSNNGSHTGVVSADPHATLSLWPDVLPGSTAVSTYYSGSTSQGAGGNSTQTGYTFSLYAVPMPLPVAVGYSELRLGMSNNTAAGTGSVTHLVSLGLYTNNASTLSLYTQFYGGLLLSQNSQTSQTFSVVTFSTGGNTVGGNGGFAGIAVSSIFSRAVANMSSDSQVYGRMQWLRLGTGASTLLTPGQYYAIFGYKSVSSGANVLSNVGWFQSNAVSSAGIPDIGREKAGESSAWLPAWGAISTTFTSVSNAATFFPLPNAIAISDMTMSQTSAQRFHVPFLRNNS